MNIRDLAEGLGLDEGGARALLGTFVSATEGDLVRLERAAGAADAPEASAVAHHIKGAAAGLELEAIREAALAAETAARAGDVAPTVAAVTTIRQALAELKTQLG